MVELAWLSPRTLLCLGPSGVLSAWAAASGTPLWRKAYAETFTALDLDPFVPSAFASSIFIRVTKGWRRRNGRLMQC